MTPALHRFSAAIFGWIPDISGIPPRRQATLGIAVSILLHLLVILLVALLLRENAPPAKISFAKPKIKPRGIELTILPPEPEPEPEPEPIMPFTMAPPMQPFIDSRGLQIAPEAALNPIFESDENMRAASEMPASGDAPLPSQAGRDRPFNAFTTQRSLLGNAVPQPFSPAVPEPPLGATPPVPPQAVAAKPTPAAPAPPDTTAKTDPAPPAHAIPEALLKTVRKTAQNEIALTAKSATPAPEKKEAVPLPKDKPAATPSPREEMAKLTTPAPPAKAARESGYQPEQEQNRIEGSISNRGRKSVDSIATPMGKFKKQVNSFIGSRWTYYVQNPPQPGLYSFGTAKVVFYITQEGKIEGLRVLSNSANASYAEMCLTAISDARTENPAGFRPPEGALEAMRDRRLEYFLTFTYYTY